MDYKEHEVVWDDEKVKRFWNFINANPAFEDTWFSKMVGRGIIRLTNEFFPVKGKILDYGMGKGHFVDYLTESGGVEVSGCDFSDDTVQNANKKFEGNKDFKGCILVQGFPSSFPDKEFDIVFLIEAIEHLTDNYLLPTLAEVNRLLKPGGKFVVTTPNDEVLPESHVICPDCGGVFHRVQHVRNFTADSISQLINRFGFETMFSKGVHLTDYNQPKHFVRAARKTLRKTIRRTQKAPHLVFIGKKTGDVDTNF